MGFSTLPSSMTWVEPKSFPNALPTNTTAGTFSWNGLPSWGRIMVTPVHSESPAIRVVWPTATSAMALSAPGGSSSRTRLRSPARGLWRWMIAVALVSKYTRPNLRPGPLGIRRDGQDVGGRFVPDAGRDSVKKWASPVRPLPCSGGLRSRRGSRRNRARFCSVKWRKTKKRPSTRTRTSVASVIRRRSSSVAVYAISSRRGALRGSFQAPRLAGLVVSRADRGECHLLRRRPGSTCPPPCSWQTPDRFRHRRRWHRAGPRPTRPGARPCGRYPTGPGQQDPGARP